MTGQSIPDRIRRLLANHLDPSSGTVDRGPRAIKRPYDDPDRVDEAAAILATLGGEVWAGDVAELESDDPAFWNARTFELTYRIESVCLAEVGDETGRFSFSIFFLAPDQGADVLVVEGDLPTTARAFLGVRGSDALTDELRRLRSEYLRSPDAEVAYTVQTDGLGEWTAYAARENGRFWLRHGASSLVPQTAQADTGAPYRDCSFYYGPSLGEAQWVLRLLEIGGFGHAFQMEALPLSKLRFWRRDRPAAR
jgi:hypothetical protein